MEKAAKIARELGFDGVDINMGCPAKKVCNVAAGSALMQAPEKILAFEDVISTNIHFVPHIKLCKWNTTDTNPTNTQLATATNWASVANDHKFIGLIALQTN